jgi:hypothetical protein
MFRVAGRIRGPLKKIYLTTPAFAPSLSMSAIHIRGRGSIVKKSRFGIRIALFAAVLPSAFAIAQQTAPAPVPAAIRTATKIFVSNAGADSGLFPSPFTGDTNRGYNQLYAGLRANSQYELVGDPAEAGSTRSMSTNKVNGASDPVPMFRLVVYDRKTHYVLWVFTESIEIAYLKKTHDRNFDDALNAILFEFESLSGKAQAVTH